MKLLRNLEKILFADINKQNIASLFHTISSWIGKLKKTSFFSNESFFIQVIFYLSLLTIVLSSYANRNYESMVENQLQWMNSNVLESTFSDKFMIAKILNPFISSGILKSSNPEEEPQIAYVAYLDFVGKSYADEEIKTVHSFEDLVLKINKDEINEANKRRVEHSNAITDNGLWSNYIFNALIVVQVVTIYAALHLELARFRKKRAKK